MYRIQSVFLSVYSDKITRNNTEVMIMSRKEKSSKPGFLTSGKERFDYALYFVGQNIFYIFQEM